MMEFDNSTQPLPEQPQAATTDEALNRQLVQLLASDIDNFRQLYTTFQESPNRPQFMILYTRVNEYLERMEDLASSVLLEEDELKQFQENKQFLDTLLFEMAGEFAKKHRERAERFGKTDTKDCGEKGKPEDSDELGESDERENWVHHSHHGHRGHHHSGFGLWSLRGGFGPHGGFGHYGGFGHRGGFGQRGGFGHRGGLGHWGHGGGFGFQDRALFGPWDHHRDGDKADKKWAKHQHKWIKKAAKHGGICPM